MARWSYAEIERILAEFSTAEDPSSPRERKRQRLIAAATELFIRQGYRKASISDVARQAGVAKGTVYLYFKNKGDLLLQAIIEEKKHYLKRLKPIFEDEQPPKERLRAWVAVALVVSTEMPLISRLMSGDREILLVLAEMEANLRDRTQEMQHAFVTEMLDLAARPHRFTEVELQDRTRVLLGLIYSATFLMDERVRGGLSAERFAAILADMMLDGVGPSRPEPPSRQGDEP